jgi:hypothetical protein
MKLSRQRLFSKLSTKNYFGECSVNAEIFNKRNQTDIDKKSFYQPTL